MLAAVGRNELTIENVLRAAIPEAVERSKKPSYRRTRRFGRARGQEGWFNIDRVMSLKFRADRSRSAAAARACHPRRQGRPPVTFEPGGAVPGRPHRRRTDPRRKGIRIFQITLARG